MLPMIALAMRLAVASIMLALWASQGAGAAEPVVVEAPLELASSIATGANGPIPTIVVDQFGYLPMSHKFAVIRDPEIGYDAVARFAPGKTMDVVEVTSGKVVFTGEPEPWNAGAIDPNSGDHAWWFDFSELSRPGHYVVVDLDKKVRSAEFSIADDVYRPVLVRAMKMFFYQRAGGDKQSRYAGQAWADAASHLGPGQDPFSMPWPGSVHAGDAKAPRARDLRGGWYDAGDYNKYTIWAAHNIVVLLRAYEENPQAFGDNWEIPESGNSVPDILDEVKWSLDWLARMQGPDGAVLCVQSLASASPPSRATGPSYYGPPTTAATLVAATAFATAAEVYETLNRPDQKAFVIEMRKRAHDAWNWAAANPSVTYWNNDEVRQPGSKGLAYGQQELSDQQRSLAQFEAALALYDMSGDASLKEFVETHAMALIPQQEPSIWEIDAHETLLRLSRSRGIASPLARQIQGWFLKYAGATAAKFAEDLKSTDPYRAPIPQYTWGSNKTKAMQARLFQLVALHTDDPMLRAAARDAALDYVHYIHGVNPLGLVYLTNMKQEGATHSANTMYHAWFARGTQWDRTSKVQPGPPPGFLVGGPNPAFALDSCCRDPRAPGISSCGSPPAAQVCQRSFSPPIGQPPAKSYLQFNDNWPADSWQVTEPSTGYQAYYIRLLAAYVR